MFFVNSILSSDIGHAEARIGAKKKRAVWNFPALIRKLSEKLGHEQRFAFSHVVLCSHAAFSLSVF